MCYPPPMPYTPITVDPRCMGGVPCIRGLRMPVATIIALVSEGLTEREIVEMHPALDVADVREALRYAAEAVQERAIPLPSGS